MPDLPHIPVGCEPLWKQLQNGAVTVHEQELGKADDIRTLFGLGLIRVASSQTALWPAKAIVLSELGKEVVAAQKNN